MYRGIALNCFRYFNFRSFAEVDRLTIPEYQMLMEAARLKQVDQDYRNHLQAFLNFQVKATKRAGKGKERPVYSTFKKFFDYERELQKVQEPNKSKSRFLGISRLMKKGGA